MQPTSLASILAETFRPARQTGNAADSPSERRAGGRRRVVLIGAIGGDGIRGLKLRRRDHKPEAIGASAQAHVERHQPAAENPRQRDVLGVVGLRETELGRDLPCLLAQLGAAVRVHGDVRVDDEQAQCAWSRSARMIAVQSGCGVPSSKVRHGSGSGARSLLSSSSTTTRARGS